MARALESVERRNLRGAELTPFLLGQPRDATGGRSLTANVWLLCENARIAAQVALALTLRIMNGLLHNGAKPQPSSRRRRA